MLKNSYEIVVKVYFLTRDTKGSTVKGVPST